MHATGVSSHELEGFTLEDGPELQFATARSGRFDP